jgi:hypothetical protein
MLTEKKLNNTKEKQMKSHDGTLITREMVALWVGSDTQRSEIIEILYELANDEYEVEQMKQDIIDTND